MSHPLDVLAEPTRRRILDALRPGRDGVGHQRRQRAVGDIAEQLDLSQPLVSKHLKVLRDAGLVEVRVDAQRRLYRVRPEPLRELDAWLAPYRALWSTALDDLERHLDEH